MKNMNSDNYLTKKAFKQVVDKDFYNKMLEKGAIDVIIKGTAKKETPLSTWCVVRFTDSSNWQANPMILFTEPVPRSPI